MLVPLVVFAFQKTTQNQGEFDAPDLEAWIKESRVVENPNSHEQRDPPSQFSNTGFEQLVSSVEE